MNSSVVKQLRKEIQELRFRLGEDSGKNSAVSLRVESRDQQVKTRAETQKESELHLLKKQVQKLQEQLSVMNVSSAKQSPLDMLNPKPVQFQKQRRVSKTREDFFCYRCGEDGHIATKYKAPENPTLVIQKLARALCQAKSEKSRLAEDNGSANSLNCPVKDLLAAGVITESRHPYASPIVIARKIMEPFESALTISLQPHSND